MIGNNYRMTDEEMALMLDALNLYKSFSPDRAIKDRCLMLRNKLEEQRDQRKVT